MDVALLLRPIDGRYGVQPPWTAPIPKFTVLSPVVAAQEPRIRPRSCWVVPSNQLVTPPSPPVKSVVAEIGATPYGAPSWNFP